MNMNCLNKVNVKSKIFLYLSFIFAADPMTSGEQRRQCLAHPCGEQKVGAGEKQRVIGGSVAEKNAFPWMLRLMGNGCTGQ